MESDLKPHVGSNDIFREYGAGVMRHPLLSIALFAAAVGMQAANLVSPLYLRDLFNILAAGAPSADAMHRLFIALGLFAAVSLAGWLATRIRIYSLINLESRVMADLYQRAFDYLIRHSHNFFASRFSGSLTRRVGKFAQAFESMLDGVMLQFFPTAVFAVCAVWVLFLRNAALGIALGLWVIGFVAFQLYVAHLRQPLRVARAEADSRMVG